MRRPGPGGRRRGLYRGPLRPGHPGARYGPDAIRDAPRAYAYLDLYGRQVEAEDYFDIDAGDDLLRSVTMVDCGNITVLPTEVHASFDKLTQVVKKVVDRGSFPVMVGGDHAITLPAVRAMDRHSPLNIVHFDAHMDYAHEGRWAYARPGARPTRSLNETVASSSPPTASGRWALGEWWTLSLNLKIYMLPSRLT